MLISEVMFGVAAKSRLSFLVQPWMSVELCNAPESFEADGLVISSHDCSEAGYWTGSDFRNSHRTLSGYSQLLKRLDWHSIRQCGSRGQQVLRGWFKLCFLAQVG